jgi:crotonobetainyl-CoA:carnitine CoA-transferase CaiB-like acyl-CoA transferase
MTAASTPLEGVRVVEFGGLIAGPYASSVLAQFGAEVIKIEAPPHGDPLRTWRKLHDGTSVWWYSLSRNKKSVTLDLKSPRGQQIARDLVATADIVIENFRPGVLERWDLGWEQLSAAKPSLVMVRISGYGQSGPYRDRPGFAAIAEAMGGLRYVTGEPGRPPVRAGVSLGDSLAGLYGVIGALLAMHHVTRNGGRGQYVDVALYESVFAVMESLLPEFARFGHVRERSGGSLPGIAPSNTYRCRDGHYVVIAGNSDGIFKRLMRAIERPDLADDPALARNDGRAKQEQVLDAAIEAWTSARDVDTALAVLAAADVPSSRIYTAEDIYNDPQFRDRGMIEAAVMPDGEPLAIPGIVPKLSETPGRTRWVGPKVGEHTAEVLASLGIGDAELRELRATGIV